MGIWSRGRSCPQPSCLSCKQADLDNQPMGRMSIAAVGSGCFQGCSTSEPSRFCRHFPCLQNFFWRRRHGTGGLHAYCAGVQVGHMWRTTKDISMEIEATWADVVENLDETAGLARFAGPGGWNDADMLEACTSPPAFTTASKLNRWVNFLSLASFPCAVHLQAVRCHIAATGTQTSSNLCGLTGFVSCRLEAQEVQSSRTQSSAHTLPSGPLSSPPSSSAPTSGAS